MQNANILIAFIAGFLSFFSPCLFPLLPAFLSVIVGESEEKSPLRAIGPVLLFILGFSTVFSLLGLSASFIGTFLLTYKAIYTKISGIFIIILGLSILAVIKIPLLMKTIKPLQFQGGSFMLGIAFGFGWSPCIGLVLSSILIIASTTGAIVKGVLLLAAFCIGLGLPFLIFGTLFNYLMKTFNFLQKYNKRIYMVSGIILILTGILLFSGQFTLLALKLKSLI